jgi:hypothetical protein
MKANKMNKHYEMKQILQNNVAMVVFTKADGTERELKCTLLPEYLPFDFNNGQQLLQEDLTFTQQPTTISAWDLEANAWRSFRVDSVKNIYTHETNIR